MERIILQLLVNCFQVYFVQVIPIHSPTHGFLAGQVKANMNDSASFCQRVLKDHDTQQALDEKGQHVGDLGTNTWRKLNGEPCISLK